MEEDVLTYSTNNHHKIGEEEYRRLKRKKRNKYILLTLLIGSLSYGGYKYVEKNKEENTLEYDLEGKEMKISNGYITYDKLLDYDFITVLDSQDNEHYFIGKYFSNRYEVYDLETNMKYKIRLRISYKLENGGSPTSSITVEDIEDYLMLMDKLQYQYDKDDISYIKDEFIKIKTLKKD